MGKLDEVMKAFGAEIGASGFAADQDGAYHLTVDDMSVSVMEVAEQAGSEAARQFGLDGFLRV